MTEEQGRRARNIPSLGTKPMLSSTWILWKIKGTFFANSREYIWRVTHALQISRPPLRLIELLERGIGGGGKTSLPSPSILNVPPSASGVHLSYSQNRRA
jgi:hypothetical protein